MLSMGVVKTTETVTDTIDMLRCGVRKGPGNLEGSYGFTAAAEEALFAPHVFAATVLENSIEYVRDLIEGSYADATVMFSSSTFGVPDGKHCSVGKCPAAEGMEIFKKNENFYLRLPLSISDIIRFNLPAAGVVRESACHDHASHMLYVSHETAVTNLHYDINGDGLIIQMHGRKRVHLFPPQATKHLRRGTGSGTYRRSGFDGDLDNADIVNEYLMGPHGEDWQRACELGITTAIGPGDVLAIPMCWWHAVKSLDEPAVSIITRLATLGFDRDPRLATRLYVSTIPFASQMQHPMEAKEVAEAVEDAVCEISSDPCPRENDKYHAIMEHVKRVSLVGLRLKPQLNGQSGKVVAHLEPKDRYVLQLDCQPEKVLLKPSNLNHGNLLEVFRASGCAGFQV